jgi:hypothetical protein
MVNHVLSDIGQTQIQDTKLLSTINDELFSVIISRFFDAKFKGNPKQGINDLLFNHQYNIVSKVNDIRADAGRDNKLYKDNLHKNLIINNVIPVIGDNDDVFHYFKVPVERLSEKWEKDDIIRAWEELLDNEDSSVRQVGLALFYYSYYTSGFKRRLNSFHNYIPTSLLKKNGYDRFIKDTLIEYHKEPEKAIAKLLTDMNYLYENNYRNKQLVPRLFNESKRITKKEFKGNDETLSRIHLVKSHISRVVQYGDEKVPIFKPYILYEAKDPKGKQLTTLLKNIGTILETDGEFAQYAGVYVPVNKKGYDYKGVVVKEYWPGSSLISTNNITGGISSPETQVKELSDNYQKQHFYNRDELVSAGEEISESTETPTILGRSIKPLSQLETDQELDTAFSDLNKINAKFGTSYTMDQLSQLPIEEQQNLLNCL